MSIYFGGVSALNIDPLILDMTDSLIISELRLPKIIAAIIVGICLALAGHIFQVLLLNPLAEPSLLGISGISSLFVITGAMICTFYSIKYDVFFMFLFALFGAISAILISYVLARCLGSFTNTVIILGGICITTLTSAISSWLIYYSNNETLRIYTVWLLGSFDHVEMENLMALMLPMFACVYVLQTMAKRLNLMYLGDINATLNGVNVKVIRFQTFFIAAILCAIAVTLGGLVAFLGLLVPHAVRMIYGNNNREIIFKLCIIGATVMVFIEWLSRTVSNYQLPLSLISATIGGPLFIAVLIKHFRYKAN